MFRFALALVLVTFLVLPSARAWDGTGHQVVAGIAWDNMTATARQKAIDLLNGAPSNACLKVLFATDARALETRQREFFIRAATWPDLIRTGPCQSLSHPNWHFTDHFWKGFSGGTGANAPKDSGIATPATNAVGQLTEFRPIVACAMKPCDTAANRAEDLAWILHLVGDTHQPLHNAARVTAQFPNGDRGGNDFLLGPGKTKTPLHTYWDHIVDTSIAIEASEKPNHAMAYIDRVINLVERAHPRSSLEGELKPGDFAAWSDEGFQSAEEVAYPASLKPKSKAHPTPSEEYRAEVFATAERAIALGGYRLANLLNQTLAP